MPWPVPLTELRDPDQLRRHYEIERALAGRLRSASKEVRRGLYSEVYDELFQRLPDLPRLSDDSAAQDHFVALQAQALAPFLHSTVDFMEIGAGDGALALHLTSRVQRVYAVEASPEAIAGLEAPENLELILTESTSLDLDDASIDLAYSCHFLEHLHPEDAQDHAVEVRRVLRDTGAYVCVTPNRLWGPHDISRYFDDTPTGLHLREYTHGELARLLRSAGFGHVEVLRGIGQPPRQTPVASHACLEYALDLLPASSRRQLMLRLLDGHGQPPFRPLEQVKLVAHATRS